MLPVALLRGASVVFWDFDGVIKDSVEVKSVAFERLFLPYGDEVARRVRLHHEANGGVSRYEKMPVYLGWAGEPVTEAAVRGFCDRFSEMALQAVLDSSWVPGVREYLLEQFRSQAFVLVTGTPEGEMNVILQSIGIAQCFREVHGAPKLKAVAIRDVLQRTGCPPERALALGDSGTDLAAAQANRVPFLLRRTSINGELQERHKGVCFDRLDPSTCGSAQT